MDPEIDGSGFKRTAEEMEKVSITVQSSSGFVA
jgi:hypothetical protein